MGWKNHYTNETKANELNATNENITKLIEMKDKIKLETPDLNNQIENLTQETNKVVS